VGDGFTAAARGVHISDCVWAKDAETAGWVTFGRDVDMVARPRRASNEEKGLSGDELDVILVEGRVEFHHWNVASGEAMRRCSVR